MILTDLSDLVTILKGGAGSGDWGHVGRQGKRGGSGGGGGLLAMGMATAYDKNYKKSLARLEKHYNLGDRCGESFNCDAITDYTGSSYQEINGFLRGTEQGVLSQSVIETVRGIDQAMETGPKAPTAMKVYRGMSVNRIASMGVGDTVTDKGFVSTSIRSNVTEMFGDYAVEIRVPKGHKGLFVRELSSHRSEDEFLLPRNSSFKVVSKEGNNVVLEVQ